MPAHSSSALTTFGCGYDHTFTPSLLNHLNIGYNRTNSKNVGAGIGLGKGQNFDQVLGISGGPSGLLFPSITQSNVANIGDNVDGDTIDNGFRFNDTLTWVKGKHQIKFGYEQWYQQYSPIDFSNTSGTFGFSNNQTSTNGFDPTAVNPTTNPNGFVDERGFTGHSIASMLLGQIDSGNYAVIKDQSRFLRSYFAGFVQDSYKVSPTLTLNIGLRYEIDEPFKEANDNTSILQFNIPNCNSFTVSCPTDPSLQGGLAFAGKGPGRNGVQNERWAEIYKKDIGPRFGFAWSPSFLGANKTVLRGGYGIIYGGLQYADFGGQARQGFRGNAGQFSNGFDPAFNLDGGMTAAPPTIPNLDPSQVNFQGCCSEVYVAPSYGRPPMIQNWSFEIQRELATDLILDVAYVGQHSQNLRSNYNGENLLNPSYFSLGPLLNQQLQNQSTVAAPYPTFPGTFSVGQALLPLPSFSASIPTGSLKTWGNQLTTRCNPNLRVAFTMA